MPPFDCKHSVECKDAVPPQEAFELSRDKIEDYNGHNASMYKMGIQACTTSTVGGICTFTVYGHRVLFGLSTFLLLHPPRPQAREKALGTRLESADLCGEELCRLPYAVNVMHQLSIFTHVYARKLTWDFTGV